MNRKVCASALVICLFLPLTTFAQDAGSVLAAATKAMGAENLKSLHYVGSGSSYIADPATAPAAGWSHAVMKSYVRDLNLESTASKLELVRTEGTPPADKTLNHNVDANSPWNQQYEFWLTPYGFLKGAKANHATLEPKTVFGTPYRVLTFTLPGNHKVVGYVNDKDLIEKVETWIGDGNNVLVEAFYREYETFGNLKVPTLISENLGGSLSLIVVVKDAKVG